MIKRLVLSVMALSILAGLSGCAVYVDPPYGHGYYRSPGYYYRYPSAYPRRYYSSPPRHYYPY
jgi:hypothetical protein